MKKIFTFCLSLLVGCLAANAQLGTPVDETFQFTDFDGNVIPDGSRVTFNKIVSGGIIYADIKIANNSETAAFHSLKGAVKSISNAEVQCCYAAGGFGNCFRGAEGYTFETDKFGGPVGLSEDIMTECYVKENSSCELELQIMKYDNEGGHAGAKAYPGPKITVYFTTDQEAGIDGVTTAESNEIVARYTLDGQKLAAPQKGINIVKYADGRTAKVVVR